MRPKNPSAEFEIISERICEGSLIADGENTINIPTLQIKISKRYGIILKSIEGILKKYF
jgi:hypothetical protein